MANTAVTVFLLTRVRVFVVPMTSHASPLKAVSHSHSNAPSRSTHAPFDEQFDVNISFIPGHLDAVQFVSTDVNPGAHRWHFAAGRHSYASISARTFPSYIAESRRLPCRSGKTIVGINIDWGRGRHTQLTAASGSNSVSMMIVAMAPAF